MPDTDSKKGRLLIPAVTTDGVRAYIATLPREMTEDRGRKHYHVWTYVIRKFLGEEWVSKHVLAHTLNPRQLGPVGFLELDFSSNEIRENKTLRIFDLAEILINLQLIEGFDECIKRLKTGDAQQVEATFAELQVGKLLYVHDMNFRFVVPTGNKYGNYDYEIDFKGGWTACADAKCKLEAHEINPVSVKTSLDEARGQLPPNRPGIIFVKVPQHWFSAGNQMAERLRDITREFLRGTGRIVSVKFYVSHVAFVNQHTVHRHAYDEINNPTARFARKYWDIFKGYYVPREWNGMPPKWIRLIDFK